MTLDMVYYSVLALSLVSVAGGIVSAAMNRDQGSTILGGPPLGGKGKGPGIALILLFGGMVGVGVAILGLAHFFGS